jgi:hypothetical protein
MSPRRAVVRAGLRIPAVLPRLLAVLIGGVAAIVMVPEPFAAIAAGLAVLAAVIPGSLASWGTALIVALTQLARAPDAADWHPYATLAIVHLLHVLGAIAIVVEPVGSMQLRIFARPLLRWAIIQVPAQAVLAVVLMLSSEGSLRSPWLPGVFAVVAAAAVAAVVVLLLRRR